MSKDPGYSDSKKDTLESRNRFLQDKISELTSEVAALDEAKQFFQERNEILINKIEYLNQINDGLHLLLKEAEAKEKKLVEALKFYADTNNWDAADGVHDSIISGVITGADHYEPWDKAGIAVGGKLARQVLKEIGEE